MAEIPSSSIMSRGGSLPGKDSMLVNAARILLEEKDFPVLARKIFDIAREITGAKSGYVALERESGGDLDVLFYETGGVPCSFPPGSPMPMQG